ncbi:FUSC family protein [Roseovarius spongiae]|nr:FUSC family protein [Roseovarius spongiae]
MDSLSWQIKHAVRMVVSGSGAYLLVFSLGLQVEFSAVITAIFVTQSNVGGSYRVAVEQFFAAIVGAICGAGAAVLILPQDPVSTAIALVIALTPLALLGARSPGFRVAPISAVIILLEGPGFELDTLTLALDRVLGVALGCGAGVAVSLTVYPARALSAAVETAGRVTALLARQMQILSKKEPSLRGEHGALAAQVRENLVRLEGLVEEAEHERRGRSTRYSGTPRLLRTLRLLVGEDAPEDFDTLSPAVRAYLGALEDIRKSGEVPMLPPATLRRMFGIGFTLDQLRRDIGDMIEIAREVPKPRPGLLAPPIRS